ncbi:PAS and helix-turn-helix domain-containing protein [Xylophilus sp. GOD-11R]|uniref:PAS and helix-turn-helix domain-containing protein n=1 Tax=Xylophilus sp. GOD-11R TaxID=3089814 RepID=UPI00298C0772|nr:PAS and helix-turn-helix domain-containing protein [Xylophilus sp. GOD-11R]WPB58934.1 PAS and helix-turn-helix domain-containing protein [Xylophilus sp. GOD-11R]
MANAKSGPDHRLDYRRAFQDAPVGQAIAHYRVIVDCNKAFAEMFRGTVEELVDTTFERLYPDLSRYEQTARRIAPTLARHLTFSDDRVMKRLDGELFWVHVSGFTYTPDDPHADTLWAFTDLSMKRKVNSVLRGSLTPRERDIAALLIEGKTGKEVALSLGISPRTVDIYKTRLLRKYNVTSTPALVQKLISA